MCEQHFLHAINCMAVSRNEEQIRHNPCNRAGKADADKSHERYKYNAGDDSSNHLADTGQNRQTRVAHSLNAESYSVDKA